MLYICFIKQNDMETYTYSGDGRELEIHYKIDGKYRPATWLDPAEYPEIIVFGIYYEGREIMNYLKQNTIYEIIEEIEQNI